LHSTGLCDMRADTATPSIWQEALIKSPLRVRRDCKRIARTRHMQQSSCSDTESVREPRGPQLMGEFMPLR
jgi:hypothetical protein